MPSPHENRPSTSNPSILLEAGTNELEIMIIECGRIVFGVNVAKIREVILPTLVHQLPTAPPCIEGVFELRGRVVELIDLRQYLGFGAFTKEERELPTGSQILVTEFNDSVIGFRVGSVRKIERYSWDKIAPVPKSLRGSDVPMVGVAQVGDDVVQMIDLEDILFRIKPSLEMTSVEVTKEEARGEKRLLVAEDSEVIRARITATLKEAGYTQIVDFSNGLDAWNHIEACTDETYPHMVITDIEMPRLDGLHLCKKIREHRDIGEIPVVLFSSLINERTRNKGDQVGATAQISKPQLAEVVSLSDKYLNLVFSDSEEKQPGLIQGTETARPLSAGPRANRNGAARRAQTSGVS